MPRLALLSCLGFPGWAPLHLLLEEADPLSLGPRLRPLVRACGRLPAPRLLPLLLECLAHPSPWPQPRRLPALRGRPAIPLWRGRLVCRPGSPGLLRLRIWLPPAAGERVWWDSGDRRLESVGGGLAGRSGLTIADALDLDRDEPGLGLRQSFGLRP